MTDEQKQEQKKPSARPIGSIGNFTTFGSKRSEVQTSRSPEVEISSTLDARKSKHPEWIQRTVYLPPDLAKWLKLFAVQAEMEVSEIVTQALREYRERHK